MATQFENVRRFADQAGDRLAIITEQDGTRTYAELARGIAALAYSLTHELGLEPGDRVGLWGWNSPEWVEGFIGCAAAGLSCLALNPEWTAMETAAVLRQAGVKALIHDRDLAARAAAVKTRTPSLTHLISIGESPHLQFAQLQALSPADAAARLSDVPAGAALPYFFTSGTTGSRSKAVLRSQGRKVPDRMASLFNLDPLDRMMVVTPMFHGNGNSGVMTALTFGGSAVIQRRFSARRFWPLADRYRPTFLFTLMPIVNILMTLEPTPAERHNAFRYILALGISPYADACEARYGVKTIDFYGSTETGGAVYTPIDEPRPPGATGRLIPGTSLVILRDDLTRCDPGETGQVAFPAKEIGFAGYDGDPDATAAALQEGYFMTGDLASLDADGWFYFVDRIKDIIRRGGENVSGLEVESLIAEHPDVAEVAVVPRPDPVLGERVTAFIVPRAGAALPTPEALGVFGAGRLAAYKFPDLVIAATELPRTETGKIKKAVLKARLREAAAGAAGAAPENKSAAT